MKSIPLYNRIERIKNLVVLVDDEDYDTILSFSPRWCISKGKYTDYAWSRRTMMHRLILKPPSHMHVDHINGDGLDNQRSNIRIVSNQENCMNRRMRNDNSSGTPGVFWNWDSGKWMVQITHKGNRRYLGQFRNLDDAVATRIAAEQECQ